MRRSTKAQPRTIEIVPTAGAPVLHSASRTALTDLVERMAADVILQHVPGQRVLDLGRGAPVVTEWVEARAASLAVVDSIDLGRGASVRLALPDAQFDVVYCLRTLPHLGRDDDSSTQAARDMLGEVARVLRNDGTALVQFDNPRSLWGLYHGIRNPVTIVEEGPMVVDSDRGITRFDTIGRFKRMLPSSLHLARVHGMRIAVHAPSLLRVPALGRVLEAFEWFARDRRLLGALGAHLLVELRKVV